VPVHNHTVYIFPTKRRGVVVNTLVRGSLFENRNGVRLSWLLLRCFPQSLGYIK